MKMESLRDFVKREAEKDQLYSTEELDRVVDKIHKQLVEHTGNILARIARMPFWKP